MFIVLQTERLLLRQFNLNDTAFIIKLVNSPGWLQFIGDRNIHTRQQAIEYLQNGPIKSYVENGFGLYLAALKSNNVPIGMCGIIKRESLQHPDLGFALLPAFAGQGYAFEVANATMEYADIKLNLPSILAVANPLNTKSIKLLERLGFQYQQTMPASAQMQSIFKKSFNNRATGLTSGIQKNH